MSFIKLVEVSKTYTHAEQVCHALKSVSLSIVSGECIALMGPSGCGKSTLLGLIGLLDLPSEGQYRLGGQRVDELSLENKADLRNQWMGFVFQSFYLLPNVTVLENVALPLRYRPGLEEEAIAVAVQQALVRVGLAEFSGRYPAQLSGGQQQRVAIARAIVGKPQLILADEPTGALDAKTGAEVMDVLLELNREAGVTLVMVTHDPQVAARCGRVLTMKDGEIMKAC